MSQLEPCPDGSNKMVCNDRNKCIEKEKVCDGNEDCSGGEDEESKSLCPNWLCSKGVKCETSHTCLTEPLLDICSGEKPKCKDGSDQTFCLHDVFTGCFTTGTHGIRVADCNSCFCELRDKSSNARKAMVYNDSIVGKQIMGTVCMDRLSNLFCDGSDDCMHGEDEAPELCYKDSVQLKHEEDSTPATLDTFDIGDYADSDIQSSDEDSFNVTVFILIFCVSCALVIFISMIIIVVMLSILRRHRKQKQDNMCNHILTSESPNEYVSTPRSPKKQRKPQWTLQTTSIVKELGRGFYSKVYLAQDNNAGFVALKTVDNQKTSRSEECISNEIDILTTLGPHLNIVRLLGSNRDEKLLVMEYCFNGNLKDYISRYKDYFMDEINPDTKELYQEILLYNSPTSSENFPMSDFLTSMHANVEAETEEEKRRSKEVPIVTQSKTLIKTRRLLYWSYQISKGLKYLSDVGIVHRDIALRNMLLTNNDVVKIGDFGLAVFVTSSMPQYWSTSNKPQPYKWMAVESLTSNVYSCSSDVWSFGVCLWEMFTLGREPYGHISPDGLTGALMRGVRMERCCLAPQSVNNLMWSCWQGDPCLRPSIDDVVMILSQYMSNLDRKSYNARARLDSGISELEGYVEMNVGTTRISTPSTGSSSRSSTRSRAASRCSEFSYLPSSTSSQLPSPSGKRSSYWANYKILQGQGKRPHSNLSTHPHYAVPQACCRTQRHFDPLNLH